VVPLTTLTPLVRFLLRLQTDSSANPTFCSTPLNDDEQQHDRAIERTNDVVKMRGTRGETRDEKDEKPVSAVDHYGRTHKLQQTTTTKKKTPLSLDEDMVAKRERKANNQQGH